jgi:hypothetical protein
MGCDTMDTYRAETKARLDESAAKSQAKAATAATDNCEQNLYGEQNRGDCWSREYQRHLIFERD